LTELQIQRCESCGAHLFPERLRCSNCGGTELRHVPAGPGHLEEETTLRRPQPGVRLGSIRLAAGPVVIARLADGAGAGMEVRLDQIPDGAIHARKTERSD
jgi:uncharacterized OB-fold protein